MIKIVVIIPYPDLHDLAANAVREYDNPLISHEIIHAYGTRVENMNLGDADIVLARGLTHQAIKRKHKSATVLELTVSAYDLIRAIQSCRAERGANRIAIIASDSVVYDVDALMQVIDADLRVFMIKNETEIAGALDVAGAAGYQAVVGGLTACTMAGERGWPGTVIRTGGETLRAGIKEAIGTATVMLNERAKAEISRTILQNSKEAILYFDQDGVLAMFNRRVHDTLNIAHDAELVGRRVEELFADPEIIALVRERRAAGGVIKSVNQTLLISDYVPVRMEEAAIGVICTFQKVNEIQAAENKIRKELSKKGLVARYGFDDIIHASPALRNTLSTARKYGDVDANVLLVGETGTGKEMFAQSIHNASPRRAGPFVAVNCAAFPENLLESELFGYVEGAFSGAVRGGKTGLFELAHGGTMFLDEIGEIPLNLQATLLRALQEGEIRRIGDDRLIPVDVRIIAATNRDLRERAAAGTFRTDLLYRLDVLSLAIPPLRDRREDIPLIARHYIDHYRARYNKPDIRLGDEALSVFAAHDWPGNTRELKNICERLVVLSDNGTEVSGETVSGLLGCVVGMLPATAAVDRTAPPGEGMELEQLLQFANSLKVNKGDIATMLGISRTTLWRRMKQAEREDNKGNP